MLLIHIIFHQPSLLFPLSLTLLLHLFFLTLSLLLLKPQSFFLLFLFSFSASLLFLEDEVLIDYLYLVLVDVELRKILQIVRQGIDFSALAWFFRKRSIQMSVFVEIVNDGDLFSEELLLLSFV